MQLLLVQLFEQVPLLPLVIRHIERVARQILLLPVKVLNDGQGIVVGALLHRVRVGHLPAAKTVLVHDLSRQLLRCRLHYSIRICFHHLLAAAGLARHGLAYALPHIARGLVALPID